MGIPCGGCTPLHQLTMAGSRCLCGGRTCCLKGQPTRQSSLAAIFTFRHDKCLSIVVVVSATLSVGGGRGLIQGRVARLLRIVHDVALQPVSQNEGHPRLGVQEPRSPGASYGTNYSRLGFPAALTGLPRPAQDGWCFGGREH